MKFWLYKVFSVSGEPFLGKQDISKSKKKSIWRQFYKQVIFGMFSKKGHIFMKNGSLNIKLSGIIPNTYKNTSGKFQVISTIWRSYVNFFKLVAFFMPYPV